MVQTSNIPTRGAHVHELPRARPGATATGSHMTSAQVPWGYLIFVWGAYIRTSTQHQTSKQPQLSRAPMPRSASTSDDDLLNILRRRWEHSARVAESGWKVARCVSLF